METESTTNWEALFSELNNTENELLNSLELLEKAVASQKYLKTGHKAEDWRNLHNMISKNGKMIEKIYSGYNFEGDDFAAKKFVSAIWKSAIFETLLREGFTLNSSFQQVTENHSKAYAQLSEFIETFEYNSNVIFEWIKDNFPETSDKETLMAEFTQFLFYEKLRDNGLKGALIFIKSQIKQFKNPENQKMINKLLTESLYLGSSLSKTREQNKVECLKNNFVKYYCRFEKIPKSDPLTICNEIGTKSIPSLDRLNSLFKGKNYSTLNPEEELPIELAVEEDCVFHSIFCCPVIKQQSSDDNPAFLLPCSHALSKEALNRLSKGNALVRFKCPYCPTETNLSNCLQLNF